MVWFCSIIWGLGFSMLYGMYGMGGIGIKMRRYCCDVAGLLIAMACG